MHAYGTEFGERVRIFALLFPLSYFISSSINSKLVEIGYAWPAVLEFVADPASWAFVYSVSLILFDRWLWRFPPFRWIKLVNIPDLNGKWDGDLRSSYDNFATPYRIQLSIQQTWSQISIRLTAEKSSSHSRAGSLIIDAPDGTTLYYTYRNDPRPQAVSTMNSHLGAVELVLDESSRPSRLEGYYYTGRDRRTFGSMGLYKVS